MVEKADFSESIKKAKEDKEVLKNKNIHAPNINGKPRLQLGKAIFFFHDEKQMKNSIVNVWRRTDPLRIKTSRQEVPPFSKMES